jgi:hypothetical protein
MGVVGLGRKRTRAKARSLLALLAASVPLGCGSSSAGNGGGSPQDGGPSIDGSSPDAGGSSPEGGLPDGGSTMDGGTTSPDGAAPKDGGQTPSVHPIMGDFIGLNGFIVNYIDDLAAIGNVREYHDWIWIAGNGDSPAYPNNQDTFSLFNGSWDWDTYYSGLQAKGVFGYPVVQGTIPQINSNMAPPATGDSTLPASYAAHADDMFQVAARYGSTKVPTNLLKLASGQTVVSGLGTLQYVEDYNEPDLGGFDFTQYGAMASADYDGHQRAISNTVGVKNADPNMKMVMAGLSGTYSGGFSGWEQSITTFLDGMRAWSTTNRGGSFPADVVNLHHYEFGANNKPVSPEADGVKDTLALLKTYRDTYLAGKELWITEFGYDTNPASILGAPTLGSNTPDIVQAQWLVRSYMAIVAAGFDRAFLFVSADSCMNGSDPTQFATSGLITNEGMDSTEQKKASYYFVATLRNRLGTLGWLGEQTSGNANVTVYKFKNPNGNGGAYVVWAPTSNATVVSAYALAVGSAKTVSAVALADQQMTGVETSLTPSSGAVTFDVSETPTIVLVDSIQ